MLNARQIGFRERARRDGLDHIRILSKPVGSGKTAAVINHIRDNLDQSYIFVSPTRRLAREIKDRLDIALVNHGQGENVHLIISEDDGVNPEPVFQRVQGQIYGRDQNTHHVLVITTEAFRNLLPMIEDHHKAEYNVFLDEGIDAIDQAKLSTANPDVFMNLVTQNEDGSFSVAPGAQELLEAVAYNPNRLTALEREELNTPNFRRLAKLLVSDIFDVYGRVQGRKIQTIAFLRPDHFLAFRSVTMIMAIFDQSLLALFWREKYGIEFRPYETDHEMFDTHAIKGPRMRIHHLLHPDDKASRLNLERHWRTGEHNASPRNNDRVIDQAAMAVEERFGDQPYCWAANNFFVNQGRILDGVRMPTKCAGLDEYRHMNVVVSMTCINPEPWVKTMVTDHVHIGDDRLYGLWKLSYTYQTIGRCSIRNRDVDRWVDVVVISRDCAERIQELFVGAEIVGQLTDLPSYEAMRRRRGPARNPTPYTTADNTAWSRYGQGNTDDELTKEEWYDTIRNRQVN